MQKPLAVTPGVIAPSRKGEDSDNRVIYRTMPKNFLRSPTRSNAEPPRMNVEGSGAELLTNWPDPEVLKGRSVL